jgi:hypothetical protein
LISLILIWIVLASAAPTLPITITIPQKAYAPGTYTLPATAFPAGAKLVTITLAPALTAGVTINFQSDLSPDNGTTWTPGFCGMVVTTQTTSHGRCACVIAHGCNPASSTQQVRGTVVVFGGTVTTGGSIVVQ